MAKNIRAIMASEDVGGVIDQGAEVDTEIKNLTFRDKAFKVKISEAASTDLFDGEKSLILNGAKSSATVTATEKATLDASLEGFELVERSAREDTFRDALKIKRSVQIPGSDLDKAVSILKAAGVNALLKTEVSVSASEFRKLEPNGEQEHDEALNALKNCVSLETSFRVKYGKKVEIDDE